MISNKIISIVNQKGGVAKIVTTFLNLGYALAEMGKKVKISLIVRFGYDNSDSINTTIYNLMAMDIE